MSGEFGTGKTIFVLAIVVGCFAVLWPKVFYPMLTASSASAPTKTSLPKTESSRPRAERPSHLHPDMMHPALRERGRALPVRTIDKEAKPGPMPGVRPPMGGGAGHIAPSTNTKASSSMSIIMPLYTVGIIIFFIYTIMKVLFKKCPDDDDKTPKLKNFHMDPEYRKYIFEEEYLDSGDTGKDAFLKRTEQRETLGVRRRHVHDQPDRKIEDEQMDQLRRRLEDTERAMERLMAQMGTVSDKLTAAKITEVLSQAQTQAKLLKTTALPATPTRRCEIKVSSEKDEKQERETLCFPHVEDNFTIEKNGTSAGDKTKHLANSKQIEEETQIKESSVTSTKEKDEVPRNEIPHGEEEPQLIKNVAPEQDEKISGAPTVTKTRETAHSDLGQAMKKHLASVRANLSPSPPSSMPAQKVSFRPNDSLIDTEPDGSDDDRSSDATETGADVSELRSFAEDVDASKLANEVASNTILRRGVRECTPEIVMPKLNETSQEKCTRIIEIAQKPHIPEMKMPKFDDTPEVVMPKFDDTPEVVMPKFDDTPEVVMPKFDDTPEVVMPKFDDTPEVVMPKFDDTPEVVMPKFDDTPEVVMPKFDDTPEVVMPKFDDTPEVVMPKFDDISKVVMPKIEDTPEGVMPKIEDTPEVVMPKTEDTPEVVMPKFKDTPEGMMPQFEGTPEPAMPQLGNTEDSKIPVLGDAPQATSSIPTDLQSKLKEIVETSKKLDELETNVKTNIDDVAELETPKIGNAPKISTQEIDTCHTYVIPKDGAKEHEPKVDDAAVNETPKHDCKVAMVSNDGAVVAPSKSSDNQNDKMPTTHDPKSLICHDDVLKTLPQLASIVKEETHPSLVGSTTKAFKPTHDDSSENTASNTQSHEASSGIRIPEVKMRIVDDAAQTQETNADITEAVAEVDAPRDLILIDMTETSNHPNASKMLTQQIVETTDTRSMKIDESEFKTPNMGDSLENPCEIMSQSEEPLPCELKCSELPVPENVDSHPNLDVTTSNICNVQRVLTDVPDDISENNEIHDHKIIEQPIQCYPDQGTDTKNNQLYSSGSDLEANRASQRATLPDKSPSSPCSQNITQESLKPKDNLTKAPLKLVTDETSSNEEYSTEGSEGYEVVSITEEETDEIYEYEDDDQPNLIPQCQKTLESSSNFVDRDIHSTEKCNEIPITNKIQISDINLQTAREAEMQEPIGKVTAISDSGTSIAQEGTLSYPIPENSQREGNDKFDNQGNEKISLSIDHGSVSNESPSTLKYGTASFITEDQDKSSSNLHKISSTNESSFSLQGENRLHGTTFSPQSTDIEPTSQENERTLLLTHNYPEDTVIQMALQPLTSDDELTDSEGSEEKYAAVGTQTSLAFDPPRMLRKKTAETSTQVEEGALSVLGFNTSWCVDEASEAPYDLPNIRDVTLDALLPSETQALVFQSRIGRAVSPNIEEDISEIESSPYVITSQLSLNIIGLEHTNDSQESKPAILLQAAGPTNLTAHKKDDWRTPSLNSFDASINLPTTTISHTPNSENIKDDAVGNTSQPTREIFIKSAEANENPKDAKSMTVNELHSEEIPRPKTPTPIWNEQLIARAEDNFVGYGVPTPTSEPMPETEYPFEESATPTPWTSGLSYESSRPSDWTPTEDTEIPMYFTCSVVHTPCSSIPQTPDQEAEIILASTADRTPYDLDEAASPLQGIFGNSYVLGAPTPVLQAQATTASSKGSSPDIQEYEVVQKDDSAAATSDGRKTATQH